MKTATILIFVVLQTALFSGCAVHAGSAVDVLEGLKWQLVEIGGEAVTLPEGLERLPFITFNRETGEAAGYAGCNNFFGSYEQARSSLSFGPIAATRRYCSEPENEVEMKFLEALAETRSWEIRAGDLLLLTDGKVLCRFTPEDLADRDEDKKFVIAMLL